MAAASTTDRRTRRFVDWSLRHARRLRWLVLAAVLPATWLTARLYRNLSSDIEELLPRQAPSVLATDELRRRVPGLSTLGVVVDAGTPENLPAAERLLDDLAARIRGYPPSLVRSVRTGAEEEARFFARFGPLYIDHADLVEIRRRIQARRSWETQHTLGILLEDEPPPPLDFRDIEAKYQARLPGQTGDRARFSNASAAVTVLLVEGTELTARVQGARLLDARVRADLQRLGGPTRYAPGMRVGFAGNVAVSVEELAALSEDLGLSTVLVVSSVLGVILLFFGWWIAIPALLIPLAVGTVIAFGLAAVLPFGIDRLNSSTAFLGAIVVGNGVNFGVVWLARYAEARRRGTAVEDALVEAIAGARPGTLVAAAAAATSYGSLAVTQFRGFRQFGIIGGIGMLAAWGATFLISPPLLAWLERRTGRARWPPRPLLARARPRRACAGTGQAGGRLAGLLERRTGAILIAAAVITTGALIGLRGFDSSRIESDFSRLRRRDTWTAGEGYWGRKMDGVFQRNLSPTVILTDSVADAAAVAVRLRRAALEPRFAALVAQIRGLDDLLPPDQIERIAEVERLRGLITPSVRAALSDQQARLLDRVLGQGPLRPVRAGDLPASLTAGLLERDGALGRTVLVFPRLTKRLWQVGELSFLVDALRAIAADAAPPGSRLGHGAGRLAGYLPIAADISQALRHDGPLASGVALAAVALVVLLIFRGRSTALWVLGSLVLGVIWMLGATRLLRVKINYANFVAFPITFGIGVDYAVNIMARYQQELAAGQTSVRARIQAIKRAVQTTGGAVALCSLTTILGYSSLLIARNRALFSFGVVAVAGEVSCLTTAVVVLPASLLFVLAMAARRGALVPAHSGAKR